MTRAPDRTPTLSIRDAGRGRTCFKVGLQPTAGAVRSDVFREQEPAVGLEPTSTALRGRCPARRASPAYQSSQRWCRASSTGVQSPGPLPRAWPEEDPEPAAGLEPARAPLQEGCSTRRAALALSCRGGWPVTIRRRDGHSVA